MQFEESPRWEIWRLPLWVAKLAVFTRFERYYGRSGGGTRRLYAQKMIRMLIRKGPGAA